MKISIFGACLLHNSKGKKKYEQFVRKDAQLK